MFVIVIWGTSLADIILVNQTFFSDLGEGYHWKPSSLHIQEGDTVRWEWAAPGVEGVGYRIYETQGIGSMTPKQMGFRNREDEMPYGEKNNV